MAKYAYFGSGCFWCSEAVFSVLDGVVSTQPGYSGGTVANPSYETVCAGNTGHAEVTRVEYDPKTISLSELLEVFFSMHDPTSLNRQGDDVGVQYRSVVFYENTEDETEIRRSVDEVQKDFSKKIVTAVEPLKNFYPAESYHKDYFKKNPSAGYCRAVIRPKVEKIKLSYPQILARP
ncbi:MAG: peptide-methionine (S)-S-oxide reductase MsrA [Thermoplasmatales archaeon]|nr:peptide-methionine (S)-S-oxide reductase MsrA [Candidatus Thermoplasmatota archaeon]MDA8054524.1 peptide-methionine (S)-S-oxide reductase MsrA [Thermoplasmatales archaeon]